MSSIIYDQSTRPVGSELSPANFPADAGTGRSEGRSGVVYFGSLPECRTVETSAEGVEWKCTRNKGHAGMHVAHYDNFEPGPDMLVGLAWAQVSA